MADENNKDDNNRKDEQDPYNFFKFAGPVEPEKDDKNKDKKPKRKFPFFAIIMAALAAFLLADVFFSPKEKGNQIDYSLFCTLIENGSIVEVEVGDSYIIGYGMQTSGNDSYNSSTGFKNRISGLASPNKNRPVYRSNAVLMEKLFVLMDSKGVTYRFI